MNLQVSVLEGIEAQMFRVKYVDTNTDDIDIYGKWETLKDNSGGVRFCWIDIQYTMPYSKKYSPPHCFFCNFYELDRYSDVKTTSYTDWVDPVSTHLAKLQKKSSV